MGEISEGPFQNVDGTKIVITFATIARVVVTVTPTLNAVKEAMTRPPVLVAIGADNLVKWKKGVGVLARCRSEAP